MGLEYERQGGVPHIPVRACERPPPVVRAVLLWVRHPERDRLPPPDLPKVQHSGRRRGDGCGGSGN